MFDFLEERPLTGVTVPKSDFKRAAFAVKNVEGSKRMMGADTLTSDVEGARISTRALGRIRDRVLHIKLEICIQSIFCL